MQKLISIGLILLLLLFSENQLAKSQNTHTHGLVTMTIAFENQKLQLQLDSAADSFLGFEHKARKAGEVIELERVRKLLVSPKLLFVIDADNCRPEKHNVDLSQFYFKEGNTPKGNDKGKQNSYLENHSKSEHKEINLSYQFQCHSGHRLSRITVNLFQLFPRIKKINVMWVTDTGQGSEILTPKKRSVSFL